MYKVMIIDDEPIIVEGLSRSIPWEEYDCQVVATANNGIQGRELICEKKPDIIFLDICMPEMDGLTMVAALKSEYSDMEVTILTGFRDFDYAKRAITLGVTRYLLKPSNMDELEEAIQFMVENVRQKERAQALQSKYGQETQNTAEGSQDVETDVLDDETTDNSMTAAPAEHESVASNFIVKNALVYIQENYREKILLSDVAEKTYVSQWHLSKLLNKETGQNFSEILNGIRIEKAKELLTDPSLRIGDIAEEVGFLDMAHFSRVFKKIVGISANEYRNQM